MTLQETLKAIMSSTIMLEEIPAAKTLLENEIAACDDVIQDQETEFHVRTEYQNMRRTYLKCLNRI